MNGIIFAAGKGERVKQDYPSTPKALIPYCGIPISKMIYKSLFSTDLFSNIFLNIRLNDEKHFRHLDVPLLLENEPIGNAGALKKFREYLSDPFLAHHCDIITDVNYKELFSHFKQNDTLAMMTLVIPNEPGDFGVPKLSEGRIVDFKREKNTQKLVNGGIYFFKKEIIDFIGEGFQDLDKDLFPKLIEKNELSYYVHNGSWIDIGC